MTAIETFKAARRSGAPIILYKTPDPAASIKRMRKAMGDKDNKTPVLQWDVVRGITAANELGKQFVPTAPGGKAPGVGNPVEALTMAHSLPGDKDDILGAVFYMMNAHRFLDNFAAVQAVWNVRDLFKANGRTLVLLCPQGQVPIELANDVVTIDEPLPTNEELAAIVQGEVKNTGAKTPAEDVKKAAEALGGLSAFAAEQSVAMSMQQGEGKEWKLNLVDVWARKRSAIEETKGLTVWNGGETFDDLGGCDNAKDFLRRVIAGKRKPLAVCWIDELEKALAGASTSHGDNTGVTQDQLGVMLTEMENTNAMGVLLIGHCGTAKSLIAKATGNTAGTPTIKVDLGGMKSGVVGSSEATIRQAVKVIASVSQGRALYIATCNEIGVIPPELQRRFNLGTFFFDLPDEAERAAIWKMYLKKYNLKDSPFTGSVGWTGADIKTCCDRADNFGISIAEAAQYAKPVCRTAPNKIRALRELANNAFLSANYKGVYEMDKAVSLDQTRHYAN